MGEFFLTRRQAASDSLLGCPHVLLRLLEGYPRRRDFAVSGVQ